MKALGYIRVSTADQGANGAGLEAQRRAISDEAQRRGWELVETYEDHASGKSLNGRKALREALELLAARKADALIAAKLDRLTRSLRDFADLMERSRVEGWALVILDAPVDTSTPAGEMMANVLASFAQFERRIIAQRTREGLAVKKSQGVRLGPPRVPPAVRRRIKGLYTRGHTLTAIANRLNAEKIPTAQGGKSRQDRQRWYPSTIRAVLGS